MSCSARRVTAGSGWSGRGTGRLISARCAGRADTRWRMCWQICRARSRSGSPPGSTMSMTARAIAATGSCGVSEPLFLLQPRHQLDEVARAEAVVELMDEDAVPGVAAGAGRAGQREQVGAAGDPGGRAALDRRGADLLVALPAKQLSEPGDLLFVDAVER